MRASNGPTGSEPDVRDLDPAARRDAEMAGGYDRLADGMEDLELKVPARKPQR